MKIPKYIILDYSRTPHELLCENCGKRRELHLPASIADVAKQSEAFAESHKFCKQREEVQHEASWFSDQAEESPDSGLPG